MIVAARPGEARSSSGEHASQIRYQLDENGLLIRLAVVERRASRTKQLAKQAAIGPAQHCVAPVSELVTPAAEAAHGSQVAFRHPEAYPVMQPLIARGVIGDFRALDIIRFRGHPAHTELCRALGRRAVLIWTNGVKANDET